MNDSAGPDRLLDGYRILDLADEKGIYCGKLLADLGADVILVEPPSGHKGRHRGPFFHDEVHPEKSLYFLYHNAGKRSITLNLEHPEGPGLLRRLVETTDAVLETFPVGYLQNLGLGYDSLSKINPRIVMASITAFGQTGPWKDYKSSDLIAMAASGYMQLTGYPDKPPVRLGGEHSHYPASQHAAIGITAALYQRETVSGRGQYIDVSLFEPIICYHIEQYPAQCWHATGQNVMRVGLLSQMSAPLGAYPCKDGYVGMGPASIEEWDALANWIAEVTGEKGVLDENLGGVKGRVSERRKRYDEVNAYVMGLTSRFSKRELFEEGNRRDVACFPEYTVDEVINDPHLTASDFWVELDHPVVGKLRYPRRGPYDGETPELRAAAPLLAEHNAEIYCGELGLTKEDLAVLRSAGVV